MKINKKLWILMIALVGVVFVGLLTTFLIAENHKKNEIMGQLNHTLTISAAQINDSQSINIDWDVDKTIDTLKIEVYHDGTNVSTIIINDTTTIMKGSYIIDAFYGKHIVRVTSYNSYDKFTCTSTAEKEVSLTADEYIIAPITATMPVTLFTLSLKEITNNYTIPTFVWFKRSGVWEYSEMPENVDLIPVCKTDDFIHDTSQNGVYEKTSKWVKELYELNPNSKFNFYYNDYFPHGWMQATIGNNIPTSNYKVTLLSDGAGSFFYFNDCFDNDNVDTVYQEMKAEYETLKTQVNTTGKYTANSNDYTINSEELRKYIYIMAKEEANVDWWLTRISGTLAVNNASLYAELESLVQEGSIKVKDLKTLLDAFSENEKIELKRLYNFSDTMFEQAKNENKEVMVFLGTWNQDEVYFNDYVKILKALYGDDYVYYYKGHPKSPTNSIDGKFENLDELGIIDIDSTIPAELIFFFNPEIFASGYQTSTFYSIDAEKSMAVFNIRKDALAEDYKDNLDCFISKVETTDETYGSLVTSQNCYVIEYNNNVNYDIAIYDMSTQEIVYYKSNGTVYEEVN